VKPKDPPQYRDFQDVEVITEFHIARDLEFEDLLEINDKSSEEGEPERSAPDVVIIAGQELVVCEGKFFNGFNPKKLGEQLRAQRRQVQHLFSKRRLRAYRHVAIVQYDGKHAVPETTDTTDPIDADAVLTWTDIRDLAEELMGRDHYVTVRLRNAVERYKKSGPAISDYDGILSFPDMRTKCRELGNKIQVGHAGTLLNMSLVEAEKKKWKWRDPNTNKGEFIRGNWLPGARWLEIVESTRGFGNTV
jgi:hypothetical protein